MRSEDPLVKTAILENLGTILLALVKHLNIELELFGINVDTFQEEDFCKMTQVSTDDIELVAIQAKYKDMEEIISEVGALLSFVVSAKNKFWRLHASLFRDLAENLLIYERIPAPLFQKLYDKIYESVKKSIEYGIKDVRNASCELFATLINNQYLEVKRIKAFDQFKHYSASASSVLNSVLIEVCVPIAKTVTSQWFKESGLLTSLITMCKALTKKHVRDKVLNTLLPSLREHLQLTQAESQGLVDSITCWEESVEVVK